MIKKNVCLILFIVFTISISAQTKVPRFFSDNMVLQQNEKVAIWGNDKPNVKITIKGNWGEEVSGKSDKDGNWKLRIQTPSAGGPYSLLIKGSVEIHFENILMGEVWICSGQSNMEMPVKGFLSQPINGSNEFILNSKNNELRLFSIEKNTSLSPLKDVSTGNWTLAEPSTVKEFSATAYFFGKKLQEVLNIPVGLIMTSWGGSSAEAWMDKETLSEFEDITFPEVIPKTGQNQTPTLLYNAMMHPFIGLNIKGMIWYQGESNRNKAEQYKQIFPALIESWREQWQQGSFSFYFVQIAPFSYSGDKGLESPLLREAQLYTMQTVENTGMAVTADIGDYKTIHPAEKEKVGNRLAYWALVKDYGFESIAFSGPIYHSMEKNDKGEIVLKFDYADNGFTSFGEELEGFEIAGKDKVFHPAEVKINNNKTISVWSKDVTDPQSVRYAFKSFVKANLYNTDGLPASPFRTDDWEE
jgi:sialate O-acetylesterase